MTSAQTAGTRIAAGTPELRRLQIAMVAAGLAAFVMLYPTQALLPPIGRTFGLSATVASLTVAAATGLLALAVLPMSALAERYGRTRVMSSALGVAAVATLAGAVSPTFAGLLLTRAVDGVALAGVVAVAMGHIGAEVEPETAGVAIGVYVSGTTVGGLCSRLIPAGIETVGTWRWSMAGLALAGAIGAAVFARLVPRGTHASTGSTRTAVRTHLADRAIVRLCAVALLLMGGFVATYNYLTYRLRGGPFHLSPAAVGLIFLAYLAGTASTATMSRLAVRHGRRRVALIGIAVAMCGLALMLPDSLVTIVIGLVIFTGGFMGTHAVASGWVTGRATEHKSQASALYLMAYYLGSSIGGTLIGLAWSGGGWVATTVCVGACYLLAALAVAATPD